MKNARCSSLPVDLSHSPVVRYLVRPVEALRRPYSSHHAPDRSSRSFRSVCLLVRVPLALPDTDSAVWVVSASRSTVTSMEAVSDLPEPLGPASASQPSANRRVSSARAREFTAPARVGCHLPSAPGIPRATALFLAGFLVHAGGRFAGGLRGGAMSDADPPQMNPGCGMPEVRGLGIRPEQPDGGQLGG